MKESKIKGIIRENIAEEIICDKVFYDKQDQECIRHDMVYLTAGNVMNSAVTKVRLHPITQSIRTANIGINHLYFAVADVIIKGSQSAPFFMRPPTRFTFVP